MTHNETILILQPTFRVSECSNFRSEGRTTFKRAAVDLSAAAAAGAGGTATGKKPTKRSYWGMISGIACGTVLMVCLVGAAGILINRRRRKRQAIGFFFFAVLNQKGFPGRKVMGRTSF
ncbi:unnamed protein product [Gongylonema pulchrum]|uniref:Transmembrane protein n=1 Tax=Gongylonema pulchrum TaxID=637853 RepID=A0A183E2S5_9BILA|nr:unnamed protein product [Gongylonema pulchrum]